jgi:hypothetical protein
MKTLITRTGILIAWIIMAVVCSVAYGILNDQITATLSPEYFSVFKLRQYTPVFERIGMTDEPTRAQAVVIGALATWWYGLFLGVVLGFSGLVGRGAPLSTTRYLRTIAQIMAATLAVSILSAAIAYLAAPMINLSPTRWPFLRGVQNARGTFAIGWWHYGAYLAALPATIIASLRVQRARRAG